jgi:hypothetical protein
MTILIDTAIALASLVAYLALVSLIVRKVFPQVAED